MNFKFTPLAVVLLISFTLTSCANYKMNVPFHKDMNTTDFSLLTNWAAHPDKDDPSDEIPFCFKDCDKPLDVDIFFLHPTTLTSYKRSSPWNGNLSDAKLNKKTDDSSIKYQASVFNRVGNIYAPRYRQAHYKAYSLKDKAMQKEVFDIAYSDVRASFEYYLEHFNNGRPFIIAAHSQGTTHAKRLIKELIDNKPLQKQMITAYLIGLPVLKNEFNSVKPCNSPEETGCFCAWRTYKEGKYPKQHVDNDLVAVTNPISWTTGLGEVPMSLHKGAIFTNFNKVLPGLVHAKISEGFLWINKPKFPGSILYRTSNYHAGDINIFYQDIQENARLRSIEFLKHSH